MHINGSFLTTMSLPLFSGMLASLSAATVLAPDDIPTWKKKKVKRKTISVSYSHMQLYILLLYYSIIYSWFKRFDICFPNKILDWSLLNR